MKLRKLFLTLVVSLLTTLIIASEDTASRTAYTMAKSDYQLIVDEVNVKLTNTHDYPENSEDHFGASAYYSNFDGRSGSYDASFTSSDSAIAVGLATVFLPATFSSAALADTFEIQYEVFTGVSSEVSKTFVCSALSPLSFVRVVLPEVAIPTTDFSLLSFGTDATFDVITWNVEHFPKNGDITTANVKGVLIALEPEVVAFQEIDDTAKFRKMINGLEGYEPIIGVYSNAPMCFAYKSDSVTVNSTDRLFEEDWSAFPREPFVLDATYRGENFIVISNHLKCCGDGTLDRNDTGDEEYRRYDAIVNLKAYIDTNWSDENVIVVGDFNDVLEDEEENNVFMPFINDSVNYIFADRRFSYGSSADFSYPSWPSDLDHILITNELFGRSTTQVIKVDDVTGWSAYNADISDHRPVGLKVALEQGTTLLTEVEKNELREITINPNPVAGVFTVEGLSRQENSTVILYNINGQELQYQTSKGVMSLSIDLNSYSSGVYFLQVKEGAQRFYTKVIKK
ncbi:MAG: T9SS type A sorting domain-containing protein [Bacteroidales bacterium]|jgi:endonuclease/exonuclease/phosphatase family metal-dependent hydrolase|nr:T9SS type A sorting domain-containing protein [Bacteroidales bacterium]